MKKDARLPMTPTAAINLPKNQKKRTQRSADFQKFVNAHRGKPSSRIGGRTSSLNRSYEQ
jgi:hypothetical protein